MSSVKVKCRCRTHVAPKPVNDTSILFVHGIVSPFSHLCFSEARACKNGNDCSFTLALWCIVYMRKSKDSHVPAKKLQKDAKKYILEERTRPSVGTKEPVGSSSTDRILAIMCGIQWMERKKCAVYCKRRKCTERQIKVSYVSVETHCLDIQRGITSHRKMKCCYGTLRKC